MSAADTAAYDLFRKEIGITRITDAVYTSGRINTEKYWDNRYTLKSIMGKKELLKILGLEGMYDFSKGDVNKRILKFLAGNTAHQAVLKSKIAEAVTEEVEEEVTPEATPVAKEVTKATPVAKEVEVPATKTKAKAVTVTPEALAKLRRQLAAAEADAANAELAEAEAEFATMMARLRKLQAKNANVAVEDGSDAESEGYIAVA